MLLSFFVGHIGQLVHYSVGRRSSMTGMKPAGERLVFLKVKSNLYIERIPVQVAEHQLPFVALSYLGQKR